MGSYSEAFDFVVVGAGRSGGCILKQNVVNFDPGNSGAVVASNIASSQSRPNVLLIEAGGDNKRDELYVPSSRFDNWSKYPEICFEYRTTPQKHLDGRVLSYVRGKGLGGSSLANFLGYMRGSASDYNTWASMVGDDAYHWNNVLERYKEIEKLSFAEDEDDRDQWVKLRGGVHSFDGPLGLELFSRKQWPFGLEVVMKAALDFGWPLNPDQNSGDPTGVGAITTTTYKGSRTTSSTAYLSNPPSNLHIWTNTWVHKILVEDETSGGIPQAVGVVLSDGREVKAKRETILSLGAIDTPKLLLLSGIGPKQELHDLSIPSIVDLPKVGKELIDHCFIPLRWGCSSELSDRVAYYSDAKTVAAARTEWMKSRTGPDATITLGNLVAFLKLDSERYSQEELRKLDPQIQEWIKQPDTPQFEVFLAGDVPRVWDNTHGEDAIGMGVMMMNPQSRGSVTLSSKDPTAMPVIDVNFMAQPYDRRTFIDGVRETLRFVNSGPLSKHIQSNFFAPESDSEEDVLAFVKKQLNSVLHPVGTVKMGRSDDPTACVDTDMCVRGVNKLRVVDLSVCPVITRYVPNLSKYHTLIH